MPFAEVSRTLNLEEKLTADLVLRKQVMEVINRYVKDELSYVWQIKGDHPNTIDWSPHVASYLTKSLDTLKSRIEIANPSAKAYARIESLRLNREADSLHIHGSREKIIISLMRDHPDLDIRFVDAHGVTTGYGTAAAIVPHTDKI